MYPNQTPPNGRRRNNSQPRAENGLRLSIEATRGADALLLPYEATKLIENNCKHGSSDARMPLCAISPQWPIPPLRSPVHAMVGDRQRLCRRGRAPGVHRRSRRRVAARTRSQAHEVRPVASCPTKCIDARCGALDLPSTFSGVAARSVPRGVPAVARASWPRPLMSRYH